MAPPDGSGCTVGNVGGILSIWLVPLMKDAWGWFAMLAFRAAMALVAAALFASTRGDPLHDGQVQPAPR